ACRPQMSAAKEPGAGLSGDVPDIQWSDLTNVDQKTAPFNRAGYEVARAGWAGRSVMIFNCWLLPREAPKMHGHLRQLESHPSILQPLAVCAAPNGVALITEKVDRTLQQLLDSVRESKSVLAEWPVQRFDLAQSLCVVVAHMHSVGFVHAGLEPRVVFLQ